MMPQTGLLNAPFALVFVVATLASSCGDPAVFEVEPEATLVADGVQIRVRGEPGAEFYLREVQDTANVRSAEVGPDGTAVVVLEAWDGVSTEVEVGELGSPETARRFTVALPLTIEWDPQVRGLAATGGGLIWVNGGSLRVRGFRSRTRISFAGAELTTREDQAELAFDALAVARALDLGAATRSDSAMLELGELTVEAPGGQRWQGAPQVDATSALRILAAALESAGERPIQLPERSGEALVAVPAPHPAGPDLRRGATVIGELGSLADVAEVAVFAARERAVDDCGQYTDGEDQEMRVTRSVTDYEVHVWSPRDGTQLASHIVRGAPLACPDQIQAQTLDRPHLCSNGDWDAVSTWLGDHRWRRSQRR